jgi:hypothetical protein
MSSANWSFKVGTRIDYIFGARAVPLVSHRVTGIERDRSAVDEKDVPSAAEESSMDLRHQARQRFINDVAFGGAGDAETLLLLCECGRADCHDFVTVPRAAFTDLFSNPSPRVLTPHCVTAAEADSASRPASSASE